MGFKYFSDSSPSPNPDPTNFYIKHTEQHGVYVIARVFYPGCTTFDGWKVAVYQSDKDELLSRKTLDPHFFETPDSPIARFPATPEGMRMARILCKALEDL